MALETQEKMTETEARTSLATFYVCTFPDGRFLAKIWRQPIKFDLYLQAHMYSTNYMGVHFEHPGGT